MKRLLFILGMLSALGAVAEVSSPRAPHPPTSRPPDVTVSSDEPPAPPPPFQKAASRQATTPDGVEPSDNTTARAAGYVVFAGIALLLIRENK